MKTSLDNLLQEFDSLQEQASQVFKQQLLHFVARHSDELVAMYWTQYTPHFNDGEVCRFGLGRSRLLRPAEESEASKAARALVDVLDDEADRLLLAVHPEVLLRLFGDHAQVTLQGETFTVEPFRSHS